MWNWLGFRHELELSESVFTILAAQACGECGKNCETETQESCETFKKRVEELTFAK